MKKVNFVLHGVAILGLLITWIYFSGRTLKVVYVDNNILLNKYEGMIDAKKEYAKLTATWQANTDTLIAEWEREFKAYEKERSGMSVKERQLKEELLTGKQQQISQYQEAVKLKSQEEEQKITQTELNKINDFMKEYGVAKGYTYILGATGMGNLIYAKKSRDITEEIVKKLNENYNQDKK